MNEWKKSALAVLCAAALGGLVGCESRDDLYETDELEQPPQKPEPAPMPQQDTWGSQPGYIQPGQPGYQDPAMQQGVQPGLEQPGMQQGMPQDPSLQHGGSLGGTGTGVGAGTDLGDTDTTDFGGAEGSTDFGGVEGSTDFGGTTGTDFGTGTTGSDTTPRGRSDMGDDGTGLGTDGTGFDRNRTGDLGDDDGMPGGVGDDDDSVSPGATTPGFQDTPRTPGSTGGTGSTGGAGSTGGTGSSGGF